MKPKILVIRKMSSLEYYYNSNHKSKELKEGQKENDSTVEKILNILNRKAKTKVITRRELSENIVNNFNYVFSAGGDGTVIAVAAYNKDRPQLNLRTDKKSNGNLCHKNIKLAINKFLNKDYEIENWTRQDVYLDGKFVGRALNETAIGEDMNFTKMAGYNLKTNEKQDFNRNSGLIIVTGTGSTGWPNAFKPFSKDSNYFKLLSILPCEGREKDKADYFKIEYKGHEGKFALDTITYDFPRDSTLEIKLSENPLKVIK